MPFRKFRKKEINTKGIGNICYKKYKNENRYKQIQTDRLNGDIAIIKWTLKIMLPIHFHMTTCNLPVGVVVNRSRR